jgi:hypothetical protein
LVRSARRWNRKSNEFITDSLTTESPTKVTKRLIIENPKLLFGSSYQRWLFLKNLEKDTILPSHWHVSSLKHHRWRAAASFLSITTKLRIRLDIPGLADERFADRLLEGCFHSQTPCFISNVPRPPSNILHLPFSSRYVSASISVPCSIACAFIATQTSLTVHSS